MMSGLGREYHGAVLASRYACSHDDERGGAVGKKEQ
jgi:hypothetical protein